MEFFDKGWELAGVNKLLKTCNNLARWQHEAAALKALSFLFSYSVICVHKLDIIRNELYQLFANFLSCNATKYY